jgi:DNA end-binding protein Ku
MKAIWKGSIGFGLVNIPIKLYSATQTSALDLDMLDRSDKAKIRFERVNENTRKEVPWENIVKGYLYKDDYIILEEDDFAEAAPEKSKLIEITQFVNEEEINSILFENPYYVEPEKNGARAYGLLREALKKSGKVGIATFVLRSTEILASIKPLENVLVLNKLRFDEEVRSIDELELPSIKDVKPAELKMALTLIDQFTEKFDPSRYKNEYSQELLKIIKAKASGKRAKIRKITTAPKKTKDLMEQLKASLSGGKKKAS